MPILLTGAGVYPVTGSAATTWNPSDKGANVTLSNGNLTATNSTGSRSNVRTNNSHSSGKYYIEFSSITYSATYDLAVGIANSSASLTNSSGTPDTNSGALFGGDTNFYITSGNTNIGISPASGDTCDMAVDLGNNKVWYRVNNGQWDNNNAANDPATNLGGLSISALTGPFFIITNVLKTSGNTTVTANFGGSAYTRTAPSGFGAW